VFDVDSIIRETIRREEATKSNAVDEEDMWADLMADLEHQQSTATSKQLASPTVTKDTSNDIDWDHFAEDIDLEMLDSLEQANDERPVHNPSDSVAVESEGPHRDEVPDRLLHDLDEPTLGVEAKSGDGTTIESSRPDSGQKTAEEEFLEEMDMYA